MYTGHHPPPSSTNPSLQVLPPANGKKLWRVKRSLSTGNPAGLDANSSLECLNNSLRISAAGKQFMVKRPPLKRPKSKPGMPKDFVFVDLSPVKSSDSESDASSAASSTLTSPTTSYASTNLKQSPLQDFDDGFCTQAAELLTYNAPMALYDETLLGLGLMNVAYDYGTQPVPMQQDQAAMQRLMLYQGQYQAPIAQMESQQYAHQPASPIAPSEHRRTKSTSTLPRRKSAGGFQFKTYKGPKNAKKPTARKHRRCVSEPSSHIAAQAALAQAAAARAPAAEVAYAHALTPPSECGFEDFLNMPRGDLSLGEIDFAYTPTTDLSECESMEHLLKTNVDTFGYKDTKDDFDLSSFFAV